MPDRRILLTRVRCCAQRSRHSLRCGTAEQCRETWWRCKASADWEHLGIQFATKFGYRVVGVRRGPENATLAKKLGAAAYIDSKTANAAQEMQKLGGARVILATAPNAKAMAEMVGGLSAGRKPLCIGVPVEPMEVSLGPLIMGEKRYLRLAFADSDRRRRYAAVCGVDGSEDFGRHQSSGTRGRLALPRIFCGTQSEGTADFSLREGRQLRKDDK